MAIGERIKRRREELGMSQDELARLVGYKWRSSINKIEVNAQNLPQRKIVDIAKALKVTPAYLMGWEDDELYIDEDGSSTPVSELSSIEEDIIGKVRSLRPDFQRMLDGMIDSLLEMQETALQAEKERMDAK